MKWVIILLINVAICILGMILYSLVRMSSEDEKISSGNQEFKRSLILGFTIATIWMILSFIIFR